MGEFGLLVVFRQLVGMVWRVGVGECLGGIGIGVVLRSFCIVRGSRDEVRCWVAIGKVWLHCFGSLFCSFWFIIVSWLLS